jgi:hypothetical protein
MAQNTAFMTAQLFTVGSQLHRTTVSPSRTVIEASTDGGVSWRQVGELPVPTFGLIGGPAGFLASTEDPAAVAARDAALPDITVSKDGYTLTVSGSGLMRLVDATGTVLAESTSEERLAEFAPFVVGADGSATFVDPNTGTELVGGADGGMAFVDPNTGAELVRFTVGELEQALADAGGAPTTDEPDFDFLIGFSRDGASWSWQPTAEAFGQNGLPRAAVGDDRVLVLLDPAPDPASDAASGDPSAPAALAPARMFVGVPAG